ncbi:MAG TPA: hypothetical protein V6C52_11770 [Coleofasciculaceae cyanobacterium]|jgi:hypothetical protein
MKALLLGIHWHVLLRGLLNGHVLALAPALVPVVNYPTTQGRY